MSVTLISQIPPGAQRASGSSAVRPVALRPAAGAPAAAPHRRHSAGITPGSCRTPRPHRVSTCPVRVRVVVADPHSSAVQLTRRGWAALLTAAAVLGVALLWAGHLSLPQAERAASTAAVAAASRSEAPVSRTPGLGAPGFGAPGSQASQTGVPASVVVQPGDTLWSIAAAVAPTRDPRQVVFDLRQRNQLASVVVVPGQVLQLPG